MYVFFLIALFVGLRSYKIKSGVASPKFAVLARTVKHLKELYLDGHFEKTVYLDDILEQIEEYNVSPKTLSVSDFNHTH